MHEGHRERLRKKYLEIGPDKMEKNELLELFLFYAISRKDTKEIADRLLNNYSSFSEIFNVSYDSLKNIQGIGDNTSIFIKLTGDLFRLYKDSDNSKANNINKNKSGENTVILENIDEAGKFLIKRYGGMQKEIVSLLCLDDKRKLLSASVIFEGSVSSVQVNIRKIIEQIIHNNAFYVIICHNHPSGLAIPSQKDIETTVKLCRTLNDINVVLLDHIIIDEHDFVSMAQSNIIKNKIEA
jgi:DNA repair protein RadC